MENSKNNGKRTANLPVTVTARRALGLTKMYVAIAIFFTLIATLLWNPGNYITGSIGGGHKSIVSNALTGNVTPLNSTNSTIASNSTSTTGRSIILLGVPLYTLPLMMLTIPVLVLFVYDKNNGVLEYLLSLGMSQRDVYKQYLKASLLLTIVAIVIFMSINMVYSRIVYGPSIFSTILPVYPLAALLSLSAVTLAVMCMMTFSSLQKPRAGGNQPLGLVISYACTIPAYAAIALPFTFAVYWDLAFIIIFVLVATTMLLSSNRLIRRDTLLP